MEKRSKRGNFKRMLLPMLTLCLVLFIFSLFEGQFTNIGTSTATTIDQIGTHFFYQLFSQIFPFITCWAFVIRKNKSVGHIWINYIIWIVFYSIGHLGKLVVFK